MFDLKKLIAALIVVLLSGVVYAKTLTIKTRNLGEKSEVLVNASYDGGIMRDFLPLTLGADSVAVVETGNSDVEVVYILTIVGEKRVMKPVYLSDEKTDLLIDPTAKQFYTFSANIIPEMDAAAEAVSDSYDKYYWGYITRKNDRLGLRGDTAAGSVHSKLMHYADSVYAMIGNLPKPVRNAMRQDLALVMKRFYDQQYSPESGEEWEALDSCMGKWVGLDAQYNSLSRSFSTIAGIDFAHSLLEQGYAIDKLRDMPRQEYKKMKYDYYKKNYTGKNRETLMADLIHTDVADSQFTAGVDSLASDFFAIYPESGFRRLLDNDMVSYRRANSKDENPDIVFIDSLQTTDLNALIGRFKGRPVLVDVWATWCGPCREAFTKNKAIQDYAREHDIVLLYISIDEAENIEPQFRKLVRYYNLAGYHTLASNSLRKDVFKTYGNERGTLMIPRMALYDKEGRVVNDRINAEDHDSVLEALKRL